jgi:hypothetical protein
VAGGQAGPVRRMSPVLIAVPVLFAGVLSALAGTVAAGEIAVTFANPPVRPTPDIPADSRHAGTEPDPDAGKGGPWEVRFGTVRDLRDHGPLSTLVAGRIAALDVTWSDVALFRTNAETEDFLRALLTVPKGTTRTHVFWAQMLGVPSVVATVEHTQGARGSWRVWYAWPSIYCVYRDGRGAWWFGHWFEVEALRRP